MKHGAPKTGSGLRHRTQSPVPRPPQKGIFSCMSNVFVRDGRHKVHPRVAPMAFRPDGAPMAFPQMPCRPDGIPPSPRAPARISGRAPAFSGVEGFPAKSPRCQFPVLPRFVSRIGEGEWEDKSSFETLGMGSSSGSSFITSPLSVRIGPPPTVSAIASSQGHCLRARSEFRDTTPRTRGAQNTLKPSSIHSLEFGVQVPNTTLHAIRTPLLEP